MYPLLMMANMLLMFWGASLTIANWMTVIHHTIKKGSKSPLSGLGMHYLGFNLVICSALTLCWLGMLGMFGDDRATWATAGQVYSYGLYSYGLYSYCTYSYGAYSYGL